MHTFPNTAKKGFSLAVCYLLPFTSNNMACHFLCVCVCHAQRQKVPFPWSHVDGVIFDQILKRRIDNITRTWLMAMDTTGIALLCDLLRRDGDVSHPSVDALFHFIQCREARTSMEEAIRRCNQRFPQQEGIEQVVSLVHELSCSMDSRQACLIFCETILTCTNAMPNTPVEKEGRKNGGKHRSRSTAGRRKRVRNE